MLLSSGTEYPPPSFVALNELPPSMTSFSGILPLQASFRYILLYHPSVAGSLPLHPSLSSFRYRHPSVSSFRISGSWHKKLPYFLIFRKKKPKFFTISILTTLVQYLLFWHKKLPKPHFQEEKALFLTTVW